MLPITLFTIFIVGSVSSLTLEEAEEGPCQNVHVYPEQDLDYNLLVGPTYEPVASRYNLYRIAAGHPRFRQMREFELLNNMCLLLNSNNSTETTWYGSAKGFGGRLLGEYSFTQKENQSTAVDFIYQYPNNSGASSFSSTASNGTSTITLTDNKTFLFFTNCWYDTKQKSFEVVSNTPELSSFAKRLIEQHAVSIGFRRENILTLNYKNCGIFSNDMES